MLCLSLTTSLFEGYNMFMNTEFYTLSLTRKELEELHDAVAMRAVVEDVVQEEQGLESMRVSTMLHKIHILLRLNEAQEECTSHQIEEKLWEYSWFAFTDEWAWRCATRDVETDHPQSMDHATRENMVREYYDKNFERYIKELEKGKIPNLKSDH